MGTGIHRSHRTLYHRAGATIRDRGAARCLDDHAGITGMGWPVRAGVDLDMELCSTIQ